MKIEAVTACVGYADFLAETARKNKQMFDRWVIVTSRADKETFALTKELGLPCLITEDFYRDGEFNKGKAIQRGLNSLACDGWVVHLDADIVLPHDFRETLGSAHLDPKKVYGVDRQRVIGWDAWMKYRSSPQRLHGHHCYVKPFAGLNFGNRWVSPRDGYVPIGYFQMFHGSELIKWGTFQKPYPDHHGDASRADVQFALQWDRRDRELLAEVIVLHLESAADAPLGANWKGRTTPRFGPAPKPAPNPDGTFS